MADLFKVTEDHQSFLDDLRQRVRVAQVRAALAVNSEPVVLYWGSDAPSLTGSGRTAGCESHRPPIYRSAPRLPEMQDFSPRNLKYMRAFAEAYPDEQFVQQIVAQIPWGHNVRILDAANDPAERKWYARQTIERGWSRNVLAHQIESGLHGR